MEAVNHPAHYNIPGRKECIVEMLERFGSEKVQAFCELNAYKYRYRHEMKNGQEDLDKAAWYEAKKEDLEYSDPRFQIAQFFGLENQKTQLIEEMAELTQAICKMNRITILGQPAPFLRKEGEVIKENMIEELADVRLVLNQVIFLLGCDQEVQEIENQKIERTLERIGEKNAGN